MTSPLTPARAIAWAAIIDAHPKRLPHWAGWSRDLREWADAQTAPTNDPREAVDNS